MDLGKVLHVGCVAVLIGFALPGNAAETRRVSVSSDGLQSDSDSLNAAISANGRFITFESRATNLVAGLDGQFHIFVHDFATGTTIVVDSGPGGLGDAEGRAPSISNDGRFVAFCSGATNLVPDAGNTGIVQAYVADTQSGEIIIASLTNENALADAQCEDTAISATGRYVAFTTDAGNLSDDDANFIDDVYVRDTVEETTDLVSVATSGNAGDDESSMPAISEDGRFVAFASLATDLVQNDTNGVFDYFLRDRMMGTTTRVSVGPGGVEHDSNDVLRAGPDISGNGQIVVFDSDATNLVAGDTNSARDIFLWDVAAGAAARISVSSAGAQSADFDDSDTPSISGNGRYVVYESEAENLAPITDGLVVGIYVLDRDTGDHVLIPLDQFGSQNATVSNDGQRVAFESTSANLIADDTNGRNDVYVHDRETAPPSDVALVASVLPTSRSVQVGATASAFATIINGGTELGTSCAPALPIGTGIPFSYQTTDPATNALIGTPDTPVDIGAGASQSYIFSLTPAAVVASLELALVFACTNADPAQVVTGVNTLLFSASNQPVGDVIALASTLGAIPGVVDLDGVNGAGAFAIATSNVGAADTFRVVPRATGRAAIALSICETNPADGQCLDPAGAEVQTAIAANATPTFAVFASGTGTAIPLDPANLRIAVDFFDSSDEVRGGTSVALRTQ